MKGPFLLPRPLQDAMAEPLLPPGRGGLILILGGVTMLALALLLLTLRPPRMPADLRAPPGPPQGLARRMQRRGVDLQWPSYVLSQVQARGMRHASLAWADGAVCLVVNERCSSCRRGRGVCERERRTLQRATKRLSRNARVYEKGCNLGGRRCCTFEVRLGGTR